MKITVDVQPGWLEEAKRRAQAISNLRQSITGGEHAWVGLLGQMAYASFLGVPELETYDFDLLVGERRDEVKTKLRTLPAGPDFNATIAKANSTQHCHRYVFLSCYPAPAPVAVELMGWLPPRVFLTLAYFFREGDADPEHDGWIFKADCYNLAYRMLNPITAGDRPLRLLLEGGVR